MAGKQCPKCRRHKHEEIKVRKNGKLFAIDRCAEASCHYNFDIEELTRREPSPDKKNKE